MNRGSIQLTLGQSALPWAAIETIQKVIKIFLQMQATEPLKVAQQKAFETGGRDLCFRQPQIRAEHVDASSIRLQPSAAN